ncbi:lipopolysaccharide biosynthesis protein [Pontibacter ramchanderi]|uniref:O-antigen/teichoic acid export membrane protein n=1 Tax=Pontibacter ramchanderi TaxID=1179743 RepID=A0A2N3U796_9BACT|nr:lipopolysaccharide biosynthesis protein [Pontibacter ramchanderi]PKV62619.1 O-antigen/teichoic acid export membrane protein [Pontibacter ramchanderi]
MEPLSLNKKIFSGILWSSVQLVINKVFAFAIKILLAKLLFPEQFGIVGMATVFISLIQVFNDLGIGAALIQKKEENLKDSHYHTAFWTGVIWAVAVYISIYFVFAPMAALFFNEPMLEKIIPVLSLGILSGPVNLVHKARLTKQMDFKKLAYIDNVSTVFSGLLALTLAYLGAGVWALVFNSVATFLVAMPLYFKATSWLPKLVWDKTAFKDIFGFGLFTTGSHLVNFLILNIDYLLIGKLLSAAALGKYTLAFVLTDTFRNQLTTMVNKVMYPVYSQQQSDLPALKRYYYKVVKLNGAIVYPIMLFFIVLGEPFVLGFFGEKWIGTILPLKILSVSVMLHMLVSSHAILIRGIGKPGAEMKMQFLKALLYVPSISVGIYFYGIVGAAWAYVLNKTLEVAIAQFYLNKLLHVSLKDLLVTMRPVLLASAAAFIVSFLLYSLKLHYLLCAAALGLTYGGLIWLFLKDELTEQLHNFSSTFRKKKSSIAV